MKHSTALPAACLALTGLVLSGCSASSGGSPDGSVVVYSNSLSDGRGDWLVQQAAAAGFEVQLVEAGGGETAERVLAERNNPVADVVFGPNDVQFQQMEDGGALQPSTPAWAGLVDADDTDGTFYPVVEEPTMLVYDTADFPGGAGAPQDWTDLFTDPALHGRYEVQTSLTGSTTQMVLTGLLLRYRDDAGELGISDEGWQAIDDFYANGSPAVQGTDLFARMSTGDVAIGQMWLAGKKSREAEYGITSEPVPSSVGVPRVRQNIGVVQGAPDAERAAEFIDWFGSAEVQAGWSRQFYTAPTNRDARAGADQGAIAATEALPAQDVDWEFVSANIGSWMEEIELNHLP